MVAAKKAEILKDLKAKILQCQGFRPGNQPVLHTGLGPIEQAFPNGVLPLGAIHEFISEIPTDKASTCGFIAGVLSSIIGDHGTVLWITRKRSIFPAAIKSFGVDPERFLFAIANREKDIHWAMNEALKCSALSAVVGELHDFDFMSSRRFQLAVEESKVTGFVLQSQVKNTSPTAAVSRWSITSLSTRPLNGLPGVGFPRWQVELLKVRNGHAGKWQVEWANGKFIVEQNITEGRTRKDQSGRVERKAG